MLPMPLGRQSSARKPAAGSSMQCSTVLFVKKIDLASSAVSASCVSCVATPTSVASAPKCDFVLWLRVVRCDVAAHAPLSIVIFHAGRSITAGGHVRTLAVHPGQFGACAVSSLPCTGRVPARPAEQTTCEGKCIDVRCRSLLQPELKPPPETGETETSQLAAPALAALSALAYGHTGKPAATGATAPREQLLQR
jgi:hypothetical protein